MSNIYIIDDEPENSSVISEMCNTSGIGTCIYNNAMDFFKDGYFNNGSIIILDLNMPGMDGVETIRKLGSMSSKASLIIMSGGDISVLESAKKLAIEHELHVMGILQKPITISDVVAMLSLPRKKYKKNTESCNCDYCPTEAEIKKGLENHEFLLYFQPQVCLANNEICGMEVLVRWQHPKYGLLCPDNFIPTAEKSNLITELSKEVITLTLDTLARQNALGKQIPCSINLSAKDITGLTLPEWIKHSAVTHDVDMNLITLEITESAVMTELITSLDVLTRLRIKGFGLSIDDFGTGFSSLAQLQKLPFTELKIDKSFVMEMDADQQSYSIVKTCVVLGHELGMKVVAEGIENQNIQNMLLKLGCNIGQGYHIAKPMTEDDFNEWLNKHKVDK